MLGASEVLASCPGGGEFRARSRDDARVAWINQQWFFERGWDVSSPLGRESANRWILQRFAQELDIVAGAPVPATARDKRRYVVDGYGTTSLARYGGSGRAGIVGDFQVKGIGRTPFAASNADWHHSHGCLWLEEGLREAVFSEVCRSEAPCGAVPVVAVMSLAETITEPDGGRRQRALLVRPFHIRPAHLQRALLIERPDQEGSMMPHLQDVDRVRWHIERIQRQTGGAWKSFKFMTAAYGRQAAYSHACGWFNGGLTSSNLTLQGQFIDFGSARFVQDGRAITYEAFGQRFGDELETASAVLDSIYFYQRKYAGLPDSAIDAEVDLMSAYRGELACCAARLFGTKLAHVAAARIAACMEEALADIKPMTDGGAAVLREEQAMAICAQWLARESGSNPGAALDRWRGIRFREGASREAVQAEIECLLTDDVERWQAQIDGLIARHTRLPAQARREASTSTVGGTQIERIQVKAEQRVQK
ncbi:protein adenylyltransferase SelO family protein [Luteimonas sp. SX5]|uniref:Protein adenylyltransferase SelO family protein n=2 Tax=Luteimonas galliterrae TaxID=2940486 RepID=A0ABT0MJ75_9GAMM|nr:protein adenylyltransferase SelO family protein [Luteimonas galliterrae]